MLKELGKIFGSIERVKLMRFFLAHPEAQEDADVLVKRLRIQKNLLKKEIKNLVSIGMLTPLLLEEEIEIKKKNKTTIKKKTSDGLELNKSYVYADKLAELLLDFRFIDRFALLEDIKKYGKIKLLCVSGIFLQSDKGNMDLVIVGDALDKDKIENYIRTMEADFGTEVKFAVFESEEFRYRVNMFDRLLRDFFNAPHEKVLEKISTRP